MGESCLLRAPTFPGTAMDTTLAKRCENLDTVERAIVRLLLLSAHDALVLLRACSSAPKSLHILRWSPRAGNERLVQFDKPLRKGLCLINNSDLSVIQWIQASLPVSAGGLGIRRFSSLAPSALLASAAALGRDSVPSVKEPNGLFRSDGKRLDGLTLFHWLEGRCLACDATVIDTLAASYIHASSTAAGSVAEGASDRKEVKYSVISQTYFRSACSRNSRGDQPERCAIPIRTGKPSDTRHWRPPGIFIFLSTHLNSHSEIQRNLLPRHIWPTCRGRFF